MKQNYGGFTLIELLVVVIIIAVLSTVALPMYKHAALKSRFSKVMPVAKSIVEAQEVYYLGKNIYAANDEKDLLDVSPSGATTIELATRDQESEYNYVAASSTEVPGARYIMYQKHSPKFANTIQCEADENNADALWLCEKGLGGTEIPGSINTASGDYKTFLLAGTPTSTDKLPTSISKLKAQICGTQFDDEHCIVDEKNQTITTQQCGTNIQYYMGPIHGDAYVPGKGCVNTIYDENGQSVGEEANVCYSTQYNATDESCVAVEHGGSPYEKIWKNGEYIGSKSCKKYATTSGYEGCYDVSEVITNQDGERVTKHVKCSSGVINSKTLACPEGATSLWEEYTQNTNRRTKYRICKTVDATTGECIEYSSSSPAPNPTSYNVTYGPNYGVNGNADYTKTACSQWTGTTCTGTWEIYEKQEGNKKVTCHDYRNGRCTGSWKINDQLCIYGIDWDSLTCK